MSSPTPAASRIRPSLTLETVATAFLVLFVAAVPVSIAAAHILLAVTLVLWAGMLVKHREYPEAPALFRPLAAYAGVTLIAALFSLDQWVSIVDSKQLVLFLIVPAVYRLARGHRAWTMSTVIVSVGAVTAGLGVVQYSLLEYDHLGQRARGSLGHYMTYSGLLMLVMAVAAARLLLGKSDRVWPGLVLPALLAALVVTFTRSAWVGACVAMGVLLLLRDLRLVTLLPVLAALFLALAPPAITDRLYSTFDLQDPTNRDRLAMMRAGVKMIRDRPVTGVGPNMVQDAYEHYRDESAIEVAAPHLHNVPLQIAAERGVPALAVWLWFVVVAIRGLLQRLQEPRARTLAAAGLAATGGMLAAGLFEYNFGDSEVLMLFLVILTLPHAAVAATGAQGRRDPVREGDAPRHTHGSEGSLARAVGARQTPLV
jgi:O-antigen ligase